MCFVYPVYWCIPRRTCVHPVYLCILLDIVVYPCILAYTCVYPCKLVTYLRLCIPVIPVYTSVYEIYLCMHVYTRVHLYRVYPRIPVCTHVHLCIPTYTTSVHQCMFVYTSVYPRIALHTCVYTCIFLNTLYPCILV